jgi:hypothetical protein
MNSEKKKSPVYEATRLETRSSPLPDILSGGAQARPEPLSSSELWQNEICTYLASGEAIFYRRPQCRPGVPGPLAAADSPSAVRQRPGRDWRGGPGLYRRRLGLGASRATQVEAAGPLGPAPDLPSHDTASSYRDGAGQSHGAMPSHAAVRVTIPSQPLAG